MQYMNGNAAEEFKRLQSRAEEAIPKFIGLRVEKAIELAESLHLDLRVMRVRENEWHASDERSDRITVDVENGVVTNARAQ